MTRAVIEHAGPEDMNFVLRAWAQDVKDAAEIRIPIRDAVMKKAEVLVLRPSDTPLDTVAGFIVLSKGLVHWYGVKRAWRKLGFGLKLVELAEGRECLLFARYGNQGQKRWLEARGWHYAPRREVICER